MRKDMARIGLAWLALLLMACVVPQGHARMKAVAPGEVPELAADEGLVVVAVDTNVELQSVTMLRDGRIFGARGISRLDKGRGFRLYVASRGVYRWKSVNMGHRLRFRLRDDPEFGFEVEPGRIVYPGELMFRATGLWRATIMMPNRGLTAIDWLEQEHPRVLARYPFVYSGHYPDPFPAFYRELRAADPATEAAFLPPPDPGALPMPIEPLWRQAHIRSAHLNAEGNLLALQIRNDEDDWQIDLVDLDANTQVVLATSPYRFHSIQWASADSLVVATGQATVNSVIWMKAGAHGKRDYEIARLPAGGRVIDVLPGAPGHILYASHARDGALMVHRLDVSGQDALKGFQTRMRTRLNRGLRNDVGWLADGEGRLRLAAVEKDDEYVLMHGEGDSYVELMALSGEMDFEPVALSYDGNLIYGLIDYGREQRDLVVYDAQSRRITGTVFSKPGVDVVAPIFDTGRQPIGVSYYEGGRLVSEYFGDDENRLAALLREAFPGMTVNTVERSQDGQVMILWADAGDQPPRLYHLDVARREASLIGSSQPWLEDWTFAPTEVVAFRAADGLEMEAFLTIPHGDVDRPLVVLPHGGPIGIADTLHFDPEVQFIASLGYAVLRVNFRGSAGYGRAFREAGHGNLGTLIEDDIDAAIQHVLERYPLDAGRMCVVGSSYGGYSALVAAVRWPDRFRCVVSIAGVSDRALVFTASDSGRSSEGRRVLERVIGDPNTQMEDMQQTSPLYQYDRIRTPVMLAHGLEDHRVDYEHARRMQRVLHLAGRPPVGLVFDEEGHGISSPEAVLELWSGVAGFLRQHLDVP